MSQVNVLLGSNSKFDETFAIIDVIPAQAGIQSNQLRALHATF
jgi:hypothetical protein